MASDTLGYMPLSKRIVRLERQKMVLLGLGFLAGILVLQTIGFIQRSTSLAPLTSALDNYQEMCVSVSFRW